MNSLKNMPLEKLWELFPITLVPHQPVWTEWAMEEIEILTHLLRDYSPTCYHIGSTSIPGILSKPIIDILVLTRTGSFWKNIINILEANGYICMAESPERMSFNKGYTTSGYSEKVFHIHFHLPDDKDEILFRDYLRQHPETASEYEELKVNLLSKFRNNRDGYTDAKGDFIRRILIRCH